jgi:hypothetical protein
MTHILTQCGIHFLTGPFLIGAAWWALVYWYEHNRKFRWWMEDVDRVMLTVAGLVIAAVVTQREAYDLYLGRQTVIKTIVDQLWWFAVAGSCTWFLYRMVKKLRRRQ